MAHVLTQPAPRASIVSAFISHHLPSRDQLLRSEAVWLALMAYLAVAKILSDTVVPITFRSPTQQALFTWDSVAIYTLLAICRGWSEDFVYAASWRPSAAERWSRAVSISR